LVDNSKNHFKNNDKNNEKNNFSEENTLFSSLSSSNLTIHTSTTSTAPAISNMNALQLNPTTLSKFTRVEGNSHDFQSLTGILIPQKNPQI